MNKITGENNTNRNILLALIFCMALFPSISFGLECSHNFPTNIELLPDQTIQICNMTINATNESVSNLEIMFSGIPLNISYTTIPSNMTNETYSFCLNMTAPYFVGLGQYVQTAHIISNTTPTTCKFNVTVLESKNWTLITNPFNVTVESGESTVIPITVRNDGNTIIELTTTITGNVSNISSITDNVMSYPNLNTTLTYQINVPKSYPVGTYNGDILIHAKNTDDTAIQKLNLTLQIIDSLPPEVTSITISDTMATKPTTLTVVADDNLGIQKITANFSINKTEIETYPEVVNITTNATVWRQRTIIVPELLESVELTNIENTNTYVYEFQKTDTITTYWINITTWDESNNTISNYTTFKINALDAIEYTPYTNIKSMKRPKGLVFETDYNTPITIQLLNITYAGNYTLEFYDVDDRLQGTMSYVGQQLTFRNPSEYYLQVIGDRASDKQGETTDGYLTARFQFSTIPQHVPLSQLTVTTTVINYTLVVPYNLTVTGTQAFCNPLDTGDYHTSYTECCFRYPAGTSEDELTVCMTKKEYAEILERETTQNAEIKKLQTTYWSVLWLLIIAGILGAAFYYVALPKFRESV